MAFKLLLPHTEQTFAFYSIKDFIADLQGDQLVFHTIWWNTVLIIKGLLWICLRISETTSLNIRTLFNEKLRWFHPCSAQC